MLTLVIPDSKTLTNGDLSLSALDAFGRVVSYPLTPPNELPTRLREADIVLCNKAPMNEETLKGAPHVRYIGLFATGYNNIDFSYTNARGITVCNAGGYSTDAVAQHTFALLLEHVSRVADYRAFVERGGWKRSDTFSPFVYPTAELRGRTMGLVGFGSIGRAVARIAQAFQMEVLAHTRTPRPDTEGVRFVPFGELLRRSDVVSVHCPLTEETRGLFGRAAFAAMKPGAFFINTARGPIVDEPALREALDSGHLAGAAVDVLTEEPMREDCALSGAPRLTITPHVAWAPLETRQRLLDTVVENLRAYLAGHPQNVVRG